MIASHSLYSFVTPSNPLSLFPFQLQEEEERKKFTTSHQNDDDDEGFECHLSLSFHPKVKFEFRIHEKRGLQIICSIGSYSHFSLTWSISQFMWWLSHKKGGEAIWTSLLQMMMRVMIIASSLLPLPFSIHSSPQKMMITSHLANDSLILLILHYLLIPFISIMITDGSVFAPTHLFQPHFLVLLSNP